MIRIPRQFIVYLVVGIGSFLIEMAALYFFKEVLRFSDLLSVGISFWIGFVVAFILQKIVTFKNKDKTVKTVGKQMVVYAALAGWNYIFTLGLVGFFADTTSVFWVRTVAIGITTIWNFVLYRTIIFKAPEVKTGRKSVGKAPTAWDRMKHQLVSFRSPYVIFSAAVLLLTTIWWATLGAITHSTNADQIIDSYLFHDVQTFQAAVFPAAHTFLIKWPLFIIERLANYDSVVLIILTVFVSVVTVAGLVYILCRIDRRPKVLGTALLALACVLLFIPAQPHAGGLLPVNFAMLTTRNIEYLFYILGLVLLIRAPRLRSVSLYASIIVLTLLISSDKLFMWISLGGAGVMLLTYLVTKRPELVKLSLRWLGVTIVSFVASTVLLWIINATGITNTIGDNSPYGFALTMKEIALGCIFAITGLLTNFGANPAFDIGVAKDLPKVFIGRLLSPTILPFLINLAVLVGGVVAAVSIYRKSLVPIKVDKRRKVQPNFSDATLLSLTLIASSVVAIGLFIGTNHYYPVDARYMTITLFALSISIMTYIRLRPLENFPVKQITAVLLVGIAVGSIWAFSTFRQQTAALNAIDQRNEKIAEVIMKHKTDTLVGDYWRVVPVSQVNTKVINRIIPLVDCVTPRENLTSKLWEKDFKQRSFTYLLSLEKGMTDFPSCSIEQVVQEYGRPNASTLIAGTNENPTELLLFYDDGANKNHDTKGLSAIGTVVLPTTSYKQNNPTIACADNVTVMNIVAHEDDDLLFMNPDVQYAIDAKHCVRTIYVTAGDAGAGSQYWLGRERASEAAYETMLGVTSPLVWNQRTVKLSDHAYVSIASPIGHREISLVYMHLPDGNLNGQGYGVSGYESLIRLLSGEVSTVRTVDEQSYYSSEDLVNALTALMNFYLPTVINTQTSGNMGHMYHDHEDHMSVGRYVDRAYEAYVNQSSTPLKHYMGYPIREYPQNVFGDDLVRKTKAFLSYATFDGSVCQTQVSCDETPTYDAYLKRQYGQ